MLLVAQGMEARAQGTQQRGTLAARCAPAAASAGLLLRGQPQAHPQAVVLRAWGLWRVVVVCCQAAPGQHPAVNHEGSRTRRLKYDMRVNKVRSMLSW